MPPAIPDKIPCDTEYQLQREINDLRDSIDREETEDSWEQILRALARFKAVVRGGGYKHDSFVSGLKPISRLISTPMLSERGRLLAVAVDLVSTLASALGKRFDPLMPIFAPAILKLCQRPNKVVLTRAQGCLTTVIKQTRLSSILPFLRESVKDKSATLRIVSSEAIYLCITTIETDKLANRVSDLESIIKTTGRDANPEVRKQARAILTEYRAKFPDRISAFIHPLTPVTRKYLEVQKFASTGNVEPLALKLSGPVPKPKPFKETVVPEAQLYRPLPTMTSNGTGPTRRDGPAMVQSHSGYSAMNPPPRPHSSTSTMRPRLVPAAGTSSGPGISTSRPLSAHIIGHTETERPRSMLGEWSQRLELQRQQSRENSTGAIAFPSLTQASQDAHSSKSRGEHYGDRQRSTSVTNPQVDVNKALSIAQSRKDPKLEEEENRDHSQDHPPRPSSVTSDQPLMRPKSVLSMRSNGAPSRPVSATSDTLEQNNANGLPFHAKDMRSKSPLRPSRPARGHERPAISQYGQTPRAAIERPAVVYLPSTESDVAAHPRAQKTWSLGYQMELLNKRKKNEGAKLEDAIIPPPLDSVVPADSEVPAVSDGWQHQPEANGPLEDVPPESIVAVDTQPAPNLGGIQQPQEVVMLNQPIAFPTQTTTQEEITAPSSPKAPAPQTQDAQTEGLPAISTSEGTRTRTVSSSSKGVTTVTTKPMTTGTSAPSRPRTISASRMPVRPPSRSTHTQPSGFVPKRTVKNSITQATKSQAARARAVMNEKSVATAKVGSGLAAPTSVKSSHVSTNRNEAVRKDVATSSTSGFKPTSKTQPLTTTVGENTRIREAPRKPPVPTVSSLVKTHAARREAGLVTVAAKLGAAPNPSARGAAVPRSKLQATVSSKRVIRSVDANASKNSSTEPVRVPLTATSQKSDVAEPAMKNEALRNGLPQEQATGNGNTTAEKKADISVMSEATLPLPSSFAIGDETVGITFKQPGETCAVPVKGGNQSGARLFKELHVS